MWVVLIYSCTFSHELGFRALLRPDVAFPCFSLTQMRASSSAGLVEARHRSATSFADTSKRKSQRSIFYKEANKPFTYPIPGRSSSCHFCSLKIVLAIIISATLLALFHCPVVHHNENRMHSPSPSKCGANAKAKDSQYVSYLDVDWIQISKTIKNLEGIKGNSKIALLNFNTTEINYWKQLLPDAESDTILLDHAESNITWNDLYPEWIDEEEESEVPSCPSLPSPKVSSGSRFDLVSVKLPCTPSCNWSRDVARLHLQLAAAKLAADSMEDGHSVHVLLLTNCSPIPTLFKCKNLVVREGDSWLYKPDLRILREELQLPVGSCQLSPPIKPKGKLREAYATILHSADVYACGAIVAAQSIRLAGSTRDLVILVDESISELHRGGLKAAGWKIRTIQRIRNPKAEHDAYNEWNYSKFRLWQLTDYDKIIFIDADLLILRNIDFLFTMPEITATGNNATLFNSGVMVIEPSNCTFHMLMDQINEIESYNGGDQGYLNEIFTRWHRIPKHMNFLKHFWEGDEEEVKEKKTHLFAADPPVLYVLHYLGQKPWLCFRDYDCNWNVERFQEFASDVAHARWWKVHNGMPKKLQSFCLLDSKRKATLEWDRRQAEIANYSDGHWRRKVSDPRLEICVEEFCDWESMLEHWGEADENPSK